MIDEYGKECLGKYNIYKGKHLYLKLANNEIITLTCSEVIERYSGFKVGHKDIYAYFDLSDEIINKLNTNAIMKMRCELKYVIMDMFLEKPVLLRLEFNKLNEEYKNKIPEVELQNKLKENPLSGF